MTELLAKQPRPKGKRLTILTNAGGPGVLATDALIREGGALTSLSPETTTQLDKVLPAHWSRHNPIDILGDATAERYTEALKIAAADNNSDGLLVILTPQAMTDATKIATQLQETVKELNGKPLLASWMGGENVTEGEMILNRAGIYTMPYPDTAAHLFNLMWNYSYNLKGLYETPVLAANDNGHNRSSCARAAAILNRVRDTGRTLLTEYESKQLLTAYDIPTITTEIATSEARAVEIANQIGYPVVLKLHSETITHKTDVGGVHLNLNNADAVINAYNSIKQAVEPTHFLGVTVQPMVKLDGYELIVGSSIDAQFGPVLLFGTGGS